MYEPPIKLIMGEMQTQFEENCMRAVQSYDFDVDKNEIVKALEYDRGQYEKGYADGRHDEVVHGHWVQRWTGNEYIVFCSKCRTEATEILDYELEYNYCPNCGAKMDEVSE